MVGKSIAADLVCLPLRIAPVVPIVALPPSAGAVAARFVRSDKGYRRVCPPLDFVEMTTYSDGDGKDDDDKAATFTTLKPVTNTFCSTQSSATTTTKWSTLNDDDAGRCPCPAQHRTVMIRSLWHNSAKVQVRTRLATVTHDKGAYTARRLYKTKARQCGHNKNLKAPLTFVHHSRINRKKLKQSK
jgi:hypothetical protein